MALHMLDHSPDYSVLRLLGMGLNTEDMGGKQAV